MAEGEPLPQTRIGKYEVERVLGEGAMGIVYLARDPALDRKVAVKMIRKDMLDRRQAATALARFRNEAMAAARLHHPGIVSIFDFGEDDASSFIVMEYAPGDELDTYVHKRPPLTLADVYALMLQLLDALHYAHSCGVVHRDIKPSNLLVADSGRLKVTDFGVARIAATKLTQTGTFVGTPMYMAPEQYMGTGSDHLADLFAAGVVLYELLCGVRPFDGETVQEVAYKICHADPTPPSQLSPHLTPAVDACVLKALAKRKEDRYPSGLELARALSVAFSGGAPAETSRGLGGPANLPGLGPPPPPPAPRTRVPTTTTAISTAELDRATAALTTYVGPIARVLVKKAAAQASDWRDLVGKLGEHLGSDKERSELKKKLGG
jgi:serine/threonine-protein kinase